MVLQERIELSTSPLPRECSTTELLQHPKRAPERGASCHSIESMARQAARFLRSHGVSGGSSGKRAGRRVQRDVWTNAIGGPPGNERPLIYENQNMCYYFSHGRIWPSGRREQGRRRRQAVAAPGAELEPIFLKGNACKSLKRLDSKK